MFTNDIDYVLVLHFGNQNDFLIPRTIRNAKSFCQVKGYTTTSEDIKKINPQAIIFIGEPVVDEKEIFDNFDYNILGLGIPILAIGFPSIVAFGDNNSANFEIVNRHKEIINIETAGTNLEHSKLFNGTKISQLSSYLNNKYKITSLPNGFTEQYSDNNEVLIFKSNEKEIYCVNIFSDTYNDNNFLIISNFLYNISGLSGNWSMKFFLEYITNVLKSKLENKKILLALSGGVDSSVLAALLSKVAGKNLHCIFVDHGLMRLNEGDEVENAFKQYNLNFIRVNAEDRFLKKLDGKTDPEEKRKIIGEEFIRVFEEESSKIGSVDFLAQGTIYPDVIESGMGGELIKSHHNVGGLPEHVDFEEIVEPFDILFKEEIRELGRLLKLDGKIVTRQPFPGPGLGVRVIGNITKEKLDILRSADYIYREEIDNAKLENHPQQYFAILTPLKSVGIKNNKRTYDYTLALRAISTVDFMSAEWVKIPFELLEKISTRITIEVDGVNRVVFDITSKPPASIEWE